MLEALHTTILIILSEQTLHQQPTCSSGSKQQRTQAGSLRNTINEVYTVVVFPETSTKENGLFQVRIL